MQGKGKSKVFPLEIRDPWLDWYGHNRPQRDFVNQPSPANAEIFNSVFKELVYQILEKIKNEPYFKWPNKIGLGGGGVGSIQAQSKPLFPIPSR